VTARTAVSSAWAGAEFPRTRRSSPGAQVGYLRARGPQSTTRWASAGSAIRTPGRRASQARGPRDRADLIGIPAERTRASKHEPDHLAAVTSGTELYGRVSCRGASGRRVKLGSRVRVPSRIALARAGMQLCSLTAGVALALAAIAAYAQPSDTGPSLRQRQRSSRRPRALRIASSERCGNWIKRKAA